MTLRRIAKLPVIGTEGVHPLRMRVLPTRFLTTTFFNFFLVLTILVRFFAIKATSQVKYDCVIFRWSLKQEWNLTRTNKMRSQGVSVAALGKQWELAVVKDKAMFTIF